MFPLPNEERREEGRQGGEGSVAKERADREETRDETRGDETKGKGKKRCTEINERREKDKKEKRSYTQELASGGRATASATPGPREEGG